MWRQVDVDNLDASWGLVAPSATALVGAGQVAAASTADPYLARHVRERGVSDAPLGRVNPEAWRHLTAGGVGVGTFLYGAVARTKTLIGKGWDTASAYTSGRKMFGNLTITAVSDAGRMAVTTSMITRPTLSGYMRQVSAGACDRCIILAGEVYGLEEPFLRHPGCKCFHIPNLLDEMGEETRQSPYEAFEAMTQEQQDDAFGKANAQAIRDGADIYQVVNAHRKGSVYALTPGGRMTRGRGYTTEGITRRGWYGRTGRTAARMTPESIYKEARGDREAAVELLRFYRYIS